MFSFGIGSKVALGAGVVILAMSGAFYLYFNHAQEKMNEQAAQIELLQNANETLQGTIIRQREETRRQAENLNNLNDRLNRIRRESNDMAELLARHDLKYLATKRPGLIENRVNRGTQDVFNQLKELSDPDSYEVKREGQE